MSTKHSASIIELLTASLLIILTFARGGEGVFQLSFLHIMAVIISMVWLSHQLKQNQFILFSFTGALAISGFGCMVVVSTLASTYLYGSFFGILEWLSYLSVFFVIYQTRRSFYDSIVFKAIILVVVLEALFGIFQHYYLGLARISGTFTISNYFADLEVVGAALVLHLALFNNLSRKNLIWGILFLLFVGWAVHLSGSRGGLLTLGFVTIFLVAIKNFRLAAIIAVISIFMVLLVPNRLKDRFVESDIYSFTRLDIWRQSLDIIGDNPILGIGASNYPAYAKQNNFPVETATGRYAKAAHITHNQFLQIAAEFGIPALVFFLWFLAALFRQKLKSGYSAKQDMGLIAAILSFLFHGLIDNSLYTPANCLLFFVLVAYASPQNTKKIIRVQSRNTVIYPTLLGIVLGILLLFRPVSEFFYQRASDLFYKNGQIEKAIDRLELAETVSPLNAKFSHRLGDFYGRKYFQDYESKWLVLSQSALERSLGLNPSNSDAALDLAYTRYLVYKNDPTITNFQSVIEAYGQALHWNGKDPFIWDKLGYFYAEAEHFREALKCFFTAVKIEPNFVKGYQHIAWVYRFIGDDERALSYRQKADALLNTAWPYQRMGSYELQLVNPDTTQIDNHDRNIQN